MSHSDTKDASKHYLQEELEQLIQADPAMWQFLQKGSLDGIWYWDLERPDQEYMSPEMWHLFGVDPSTKKHNPAEWQDLIFQEDLDQALKNFQAHCADPDCPYDQVVRYRHADGSTVWVRCRGIAIRDEHGKAIRMLGAHNDLTTVKLTEQDANAANDRLFAANAELRSFAYSVSHDMKAPANTLDMILGELTTHLQDNDDAEGLELANMGRHAVDRMRTLVEDVLDYTRVVGQPLNFEEVDLESCVKDVLEDLAADINGKSARVEVEHLPTINANAVQMRLLFQNLMANALKFQREGTLPVVKIKHVNNSIDGFTVISVQDNGIGIEERFYDRIFTMFERLHTRAEFSGTGLGLPLCRRIALNHDGDISVKSVIDQGSTFTVQLSNRLS